MTTLPEVPLGRALQRVAAIWHPDGAPHHLIVGQSGVGKSTMVKALLSLCPFERAVVFNPKPAFNKVWYDADDPARWGQPVRVERWMLAEWRHIERFTMPQDEA